MGRGFSNNSQSGMEAGVADYAIQRQFDLNAKQPITGDSLNWGNNQNTIPTDAQLMMSMEQKLESAKQNKMPTGYTNQYIRDINIQNAIEQKALEAAWDKANPAPVRKKNFFGF